MNNFTSLKKQLLLFCCIFAFANQNATAQSFGGFFFDPVVTCNGKTISMVARTDTWTNVALFQFAMEWDPTVLEYVNTTVPNSTFADLEFGNTNVASGKLLTSWYDQSAAAIGISPDNEVAFTIIFNVIGEGGDQTLVDFTNAIPMEFYYYNNGDETDYTLDVVLGPGQVEVTEKPSADMETIVNTTSSAASDGSISLDNIIGGTAPYEILWTNGESGMELTNLPAGDYSCTVTDANTCSTTNGPYSVNADVSSNDNIEGLNKFDLSPNPTNGLVNINVAFAKNEKVNIRILDVTGKMMYQQEQEAATFTVDVPVESFANGTYFVEIATATGKAVQKLIVAK